LLRSLRDSGRLALLDVHFLPELVRGTVIRLFSPDRTLVVEVDDPGVSMTVDGSDVITDAGA
jgi:hypothetical protein